jgi:hypothetical protein
MLLCWPKKEWNFSCPNFIEINQSKDITDYLRKRFLNYSVIHHKKCWSDAKQHLIKIMKLLTSNLMFKKIISLKQNLAWKNCTNFRAMEFWNSCNVLCACNGILKFRALCCARAVEFCCTKIRAVRVQSKLLRTASVRVQCAVCACCVLTLDWNIWTNLTFILNCKVP